MATAIFQVPGLRIKSIQRGTISAGSGTSATATISAVTVAKSVVNMTGALQVTQATAIGARITLTDTTTVTVNVGVTMAWAVDFEVIEFY